MPSMMSVNDLERSRAYNCARCPRFRDPPPHPLPGWIWGTRQSACGGRSPAPVIARICSQTPALPVHTSREAYGGGNRVPPRRVGPFWCAKSDFGRLLSILAVSEQADGAVTRPKVNHSPRGCVPRFWGRFGAVYCAVRSPGAPSTCPKRTHRAFRAVAHEFGRADGAINGWNPHHSSSPDIPRYMGGKGSIY